MYEVHINLCRLAVRKVVASAAQNMKTQNEACSVSAKAEYPEGRGLITATLSLLYQPTDNCRISTSVNVITSASSLYECKKGKKKV